MTDPGMSKTLYVFRRAKDARPLNPEEAVRRADFRVLPFAYVSAGTPAPAPNLLSSSHANYPLDRARVLMGIDYLVDPQFNIDVLNLSLGPASGTFDRKDPLQIATRFVHAHGIVVVVAAGNEGPAQGTLQPLAQAPWTIAVGACDWGGERLLDSSSRGRQGGREPTVVAVGLPEIVVVGQPDFEPGTSFAAPKISRLALWSKKCLELILHNVRDVRNGSWSTESSPVRLPVLGLADTGVDRRALDPLPPKVQALLNAGQDSVRLAREARERDWISRWLEDMQRYELPVTLEISPDLVKRALQMMAKPMPGYRPHEVGAGYVGMPQVSAFFSTLTPGRLTALLSQEMTLAHQMMIAETLDPQLGPLWNPPFVETTQTYFYFGHQLAVAKVM